MTRTLASYIAMGYWLKEGDENKPLKLAQKLSLDEIEADMLEFMEDMPTVPKENANGSFERLMLSMGNGMQRG